MVLSAIPLEFALLLCFLLGSLTASFLNLAIYRLAWNSRATSPWSKPPQELPPRTLVDRIPILGWLRLRRESHHWGKAFWVRPLLIELFFGLGMAMLYWYEVDADGLFGSRVLQDTIPVSPWWTPLSKRLAFGLFCGHYLLFSLMLVATFIDIDEKTIPDTITLPGTLLGLLLVTLNPWMAPPETNCQLAVGKEAYTDFMHVVAPLPWSDIFSTKPTWGALALGLGFFWIWCFALLPRCWYTRYGSRRAARYFVAKLFRTRFSALILAVAAFGALGILAVWYYGGFHWAGLLSSLFGVAFGTGILWSVRLIGGAALRKEAMGFGDVTLMAMIGSFIGWQATLIVFFLAPFAGLVVGLLQWILKRDNVVPYGPFLCFATAVLLIFWPSFWGYLGPFFLALGGSLPLVLLACLAMMAVLLVLLQRVKAVLFKLP